MEQVALLAQQNTLPEPTLDISILSYSAAPPPTSLAAAAAGAYSNHQPSTAPTLGSGGSGGSAAPAGLRDNVAVPPPPDDPWMTGVRYGYGGIGGAAPFGAGAGAAVGLNGAGTSGVGAPPSSVSGTGLPSGWWKRLEKVTVQFAGQQGFVLNRYMVYGITTEVRSSDACVFRPLFIHFWGGSDD